VYHKAISKSIKKVRRRRIFFNYLIVIHWIVCGMSIRYFVVEKAGNTLYNSMTDEQAVTISCKR
jgi:hypothetical protein